ncbi:MAG TPA: glycosyltransferase [Kineosporiaceae bacterium]
MEHHVAQLATGLAQSGDEVTVVTHRLDRAHPLVEESDVVVRRFPLTVATPDYRYSMALSGFLRQSRGAFDVVHVQSYHTLVGVNALLAGIDRLIFTPHYHGTGHTRFRALLHKPYRLVGRRVVDRSAVIICVSQAEAQLFRSDFPAAQRVHVIPNGASAPAPSPEAVHSCPVTDDDVVTIGRLETYKRNDLLIEALTRLSPPTRLVVVGEGPARPELERRAAELDVRDRVLFLGRVSRDALDAVLARAPVVASASEHEAFGLSVADGIAAGARVVASDLPSHREVLRLTDNAAAVLVDRDADSLAKALREALVLGRPRDRSTLPSWAEITARTRQLYALVGAA